MSNNMNGRKRIASCVLSTCLFLFIFSGCGEEAYSTNTLVLDKDGGIKEYLVEDFPVDLYDIDEWKSEATSEIDALNKNYGSDDITMSDVVMNDSVLQCTIEYASDDAYFDLNGTPIFVGTIAQAVTAGYSLLVPVEDAYDNTPISSDEVLKMDDSHIVIISEPCDIKTYKNIMYVSEGVTVGEDKKTATVDGEGTSYIIFK